VILLDKKEEGRRQNILIGIDGCYSDSVTRLFASGFLHESVSPPAPEYSVKTISNFTQQHRRQVFPPVSLVVDTDGKFATSVNNAGGKLPPVSTTPAANLPPVAFTPVANNGSNYQTAENLK
jgi:hypothetical protein